MTGIHGIHSIYIRTESSYQCTEVRFFSFFSGGFITAIVVNLPEKKLAKRISEQWSTKGQSIRPNPKFFTIFTWFHQKWISKVRTKSANKIELRQMDNILEKFQHSASAAVFSQRPNIFQSSAFGFGQM